MVGSQKQKVFVPRNQTQPAMSLQEEMINAAGSRMAAEIDFQVLSEMLCGLGWTRVVLRPMTYEHGVEIDTWVAENVRGHHQTMGLVWVFEDPKDANWFTLRWL